MAIIRGYMGVSLDGYIAGDGGDLGWLTKYDNADFGRHGYATFIEAIRTVAMGRATYDWLIAAGTPWPYAGQRTIIVTSRPIDNAPAPLATWSKGVPALVAHLRALDDGDAWIVGGGKLQQAVIAEGGLDRLELFIVPEIIGGGIAAFPPNGHKRSVRLNEANTLGSGIVRLDYAFAG
jgi:dihydrofolate reductase